MKKVTALLLTLTILFSITGCSSKKQARAGFLSDYSNLEIEGEFNLCLSPEYGQLKYTKLIVDPVVAYLHEEPEALKEQQEGRITREEIDECNVFIQTMTVASANEPIQTGGK
ncbi:MAG: DUF3313 domain-containing protein [Planctomycetota bacterium]|jgi:hypothetical protein